MINAFIVDDEPYCAEALAILLGRYCPQVHIEGIYHSGAQALVAIRELQPQLLFLDIEMPRMNGFELLEKVKDLDFELIFTTSYDQYAIKAIRHSALDYLLKPIDREELQTSIRKVEQRLKAPLTQQFDLLFQKLQNPASLFSKIAIPTMEGLQMVGSTASSTASRTVTIPFLRSKKNKSSSPQRRSRRSRSCWKTTPFYASIIRISSISMRSANISRGKAVIL